MAWHARFAFPDNSSHQYRSSTANETSLHFGRSTVGNIPRHFHPPSADQMSGQYRPPSVVSPTSNICSTSPSTEILYHKVFRPLVIMARTFLLSTETCKKARGFLFKFRIFYWTFLFLLIFLVIVSKLVWLGLAFKTKGFQLGTVLDLASCIWACEGIVSFCYILYWQHNNKIKKILQLLFEANQLKGIEGKKLYLTRYMTVVSLISSIFCIITFVSIVFCIFEIKPLSLTDVRYSNVLFGLPSLNGFVAFAYIYISLSWTLAMLMCIGICRSILCEFHYFNEMIENEKKIDKFFLSNCSTVHTKLVVAVEELCKSFSGYYFFTLCFQLPLIVLLSFNIMTQSFSFNELSTVLGWLANGSVKVAILSLIPARITEAAEDTSDVVMQAFDQNQIFHDIETFNIVSYFTQKVKSQKIGLNVGGFFFVTKELILTVISLIITYLTLVYQSYVPPTKSADMVANSTCSC